MKRSELITRSIIVIVAATAVAVPVWVWSRTPLIHARIAENGGWSPDVARARVGEPLHLHLTSDDVTHGFAVGQTDVQSVDVFPGKITDITLVFDKPGTYTFYCTRWCGINHWRMRGTIEVSGAVSDPLTSVERPLYVTLGLNLDAPHDSPSIPGVRASAQRGRQLAADFPISQFTNPGFYRAHSPYQAWQILRANDSLSKNSDQQIWDMVAFIWQSSSTTAQITAGRQLYFQNCAACHGETGAANGVFADELAAAGKASAQMTNGAQNMAVQRPADFTDPQRMLGASPALLQGKILRGGMGTGMPSWGPIFSQEQVWDLIVYLYSFQFEYQW